MSASIELVRQRACDFGEGYEAGYNDGLEGNASDSETAWDLSRASAELGKLTALPAHQERTEPHQPLNADGEPLHTGDDERIDCVTGIRAALEEIIDEEGKPECDHCADLLSGALDECEKLDTLLIETIARERAAHAPARAAEWHPDHRKLSALKVASDAYLAADVRGEVECLEHLERATQALIIAAQDVFEDAPQEITDAARAAEWKPAGAELIAAERQRQMTAEGWTDSHDDAHALGELVTAAMCYAIHASNQARPQAKQDMTAVILSRWPWERRWWKPSDDPRRNLVKAGALIAAEIDRLHRALPPLRPHGQL